MHHPLLEPPVKRGHTTWISEGETITEVMHNAIRFHLDHDSPDAVLNIESHLFNVLLVAKSCEYDLDVGKELWLNRQRWSRLIKEYVAKDALELFVAQSKEILTGEARKGATTNMLFRSPDRYAKKHRWGGCLMGATFRGDYDNRPTLTFYSRTTYIGYMGLLDAGIAHCMSRLISEDSFNGIAFRWHLSSSQLHCFKTLPFIFSQPDLLKILKQRDVYDRSPTWKHIRKWYDKILLAYRTHGVDMLAHEKYGPFKRIKRRWLEHKGYLDKHVPPSLSVSDLDFSKAI